jgi:TPR repeat protein
MRRYPGILPRWRLRLPGLPTEYRTVARIRRYAPLSGNPPPVALTLTGATDRLPNRSPDKALCAAIRVFTPLIPAIFFFSAALYTAGVSLTDNKKMKYLYLLLALTSFAADAAAPGSQYQQQAEAGDPRAQFYLADTWVSSGNYQQAEYWAQKAAAQGDGDAMALLAQLKIRNPQQADYQQARQLAEKSVQAGSKAGEIILARVLVNQQAGPTDYAHAIRLLQDAAKDEESDSAVDAQMLLGLIYASGVLPPEDDLKAAQYFKGSSALSRTGYAEYWAGMMFQQGEKGFIEPNPQKALHWLNVSCQEGFDTGCEEFDRITKG